MLSYHAMSASHRGQNERVRVRRLILLGQRWTKALRKLPTIAPKSVQPTQKTVSGVIGTTSVGNCKRTAAIPQPELLLAPRDSTLLPRLTSTPHH
jgi:hypothetical protein